MCVCVCVWMGVWVGVWVCVCVCIAIEGPFSLLLGVVPGFRYLFDSYKKKLGPNIRWICAWYIEVFFSSTDQMHIEVSPPPVKFKIFSKAVSINQFVKVYAVSKNQLL